MTSDIKFAAPDVRAASRSDDSVPIQSSKKNSPAPRNSETSMVNWCFPCYTENDESHGISNIPPDIDFHANSMVKLTHGLTAYKLIKPIKRASTGLNHAEPVKNAIIDPLIVCLHGWLNSSYMWESIATLLSSFEQGPHAQVLIFDFYGRGRSEWTGSHE